MISTGEDQIEEATDKETSMKSDVMRIKEALPEDWQIIHGEESWGDFGHLGAVVLVCFQNQASDETRRLARRGAKQALGEVEKDVIRSRPAFHEDRLRVKTELLACFGDTCIYVEEIPNEYRGDDALALTSPWFKVTTPIGHFKIGWRKRVIVVDWSETEVDVWAENLFADDVTKNGQMIHAWSYDKASEYIGCLFNHHKDKKAEGAKGEVQRTQDG